MKSWNRINLLVIIILLILISGLTYKLFEPAQMQMAQMDTQSNIPKGFTNQELLTTESEWSKRIEEFGADRAYQLFKEEFKKAQFGNQHTVAHFMGAEIYKVEGIEGVQVCDSSFAFGCYHGFFSRALGELGPGIVKQLDEACISKFGPLGSGCQHGIGHGLMEFFGSKNLLMALKTCDQTTFVNELAGCAPGVFMEYNVPIVIDNGVAKVEVRQLDRENPLDECLTLPDKFKPSCYHELAAWWNQAGFHGNYKQMGEWCGTASKKYTESCYLGIGNVVAPSNNYNVNKTIDACSRMPNLEGRIVCQAGASWSFDANPDYRSLAVNVCGELSGEALSRCKKLAHILNPENQ